MAILARWRAALRGFLEENEADHTLRPRGWTRYVQEVYLAGPRAAGTGAHSRRQRWQDYEKPPDS